MLNLIFRPLWNEQSVQLPMDPLRNDIDNSNHPCLHHRNCRDVVARVIES